MAVHLVNTAVKEFSIGDYMGKEVFCLTGICQIAASLSSDIYLLSGLLILFKKCYPGTPSSCCDGRHHARCTAADHDYLIHCHLPLPVSSGNSSKSVLHR